VVGNLDEVEVAIGEKGPHRAVQKLIESGVSLAVAKKGARGVVGATPKEVVELPGFKVRVVNGPGAGMALAARCAMGY
jgi:5-dehydro-2-deoxygluconokinase